MKFFFLLCSAFLFFQDTLRAQSASVVVRDLRSEWKVESGGLVQDGEAPKGRSVFFQVDANKYKGDRLEISGPRDFSVLINQKLITHGKHTRLSFSIDSLAKLYSQPLTLNVFAARGLEFVQTRIVSDGRTGKDDISALRRSRHVLDFSVLAVFILAVYFILLLRFNPRLTMDYFNVARLFSMQERDENLIMGRLMSRFSFLVYIFIGLWSSFLLLIIFHYTRNEWTILQDFQINSWQDGFVKWAWLTGIIFVILFIKLAITSLFSWIFKLREGAGIQILNYWRMISFLMLMISVAMLIFFATGTEKTAYYNNLIYLMSWILVFWTVLIFVKLLSKVPFSVFHLFSYLCASEFFPIIVIFRVLFF